MTRYKKYRDSRNEMLQKDNGKDKKRKDKGSIKTEICGQNIAENAAEMVWTCGKNGLEKKTETNN